jgi:hypothetical protein
MRNANGEKKSTMSPIMRTPFNLLLPVCIILLACNSVLGQTTHFLFKANTGNKATVEIPSSIKPTICGHTISVGDEIGVFTPGGLCVGAAVWTGSNISITVWGDDDQPTGVDGIRPGEQIQFRVLRKSENIVYSANVRDSLGIRTFIKNDIYHLSSLVADVHMGTHFTYRANTGNFEIILIPKSINPTISGAAIVIGDEIGVFTLGGLCVGAAVWSNSNNILFVWGDDNQTKAIDGIGAGEQMQFRVWRESTKTEFPAQVTFTKGAGTYATKGISKLGSLIVPMRIKVKVFLQGPYSSGTMTTILNTNSLIPLISSAAYNATTYGYAAKAVGAIPNADVVDWILVELRTGTAASTKVETQAAFLLKDGSVVDIDGSSDVAFTIATAGDYYIVIRHRNHLAVMSAASVKLPNASAYDFTTSMGQAYGATTPMKNLTGSGPFGMWAGDANSDGQLKYSGSGSDRQVLLNLIGAATLTNVVSGYYTSDFNMNGQVKYSGSGSDRQVLLNNVGFTTPSNVVNTQVP